MGERNVNLRTIRSALEHGLGADDHPVLTWLVRHGVPAQPIPCRSRRADLVGPHQGEEV